jgi:hypothetical protein
VRGDSARARRTTGVRTFDGRWVMRPLNKQSPTLPQWECRTCGSRWQGPLNPHECDPRKVDHISGRIAEKRYIQSPYRAWNLAIDEDAQREVDAIVTDDGA